MGAALLLTSIGEFLDKSLHSLAPAAVAPQIAVFEVVGARHFSAGTSALPCMADGSGWDRGFSMPRASVRLPQCPAVQDSLLLLYRSGACGLGGAEGAKPQVPAGY
jgi:hypothetical protein